MLSAQMNGADPQNALYVSLILMNKQSLPPNIERERENNIGIRIASSFLPISAAAAADSLSLWCKSISEIERDAERNAPSSSNFHINGARFLSVSNNPRARPPHFSLTGNKISALIDTHCIMKLLMMMPRNKSQYRITYFWLAATGEILCADDLRFVSESSSAFLRFASQKRGVTASVSIGYQNLKRYFMLSFELERKQSIDVNILK